MVTDTVIWGKYLYKPEFCEPRPPFQWARAFTWRCQVNGARLRQCLRSVQGESFRERVGRKQKSLPLSLSCRIRVRLGSRFLSVIFAGETDEAKEKRAHSGNQMGPDRVSVESTWRRLPDRSPWFNCSQRILAGPPHVPAPSQPRGRSSGGAPVCAPKGY